MIFNEHSNLIGQHAFLSASKYHWTNYTNEKLNESYINYLATMKGTELHDFACQCIKLKQKLPRNHQTINMYVNDAIGFNMIPEQPLFYSVNCFGTADAISFKNKKLRIHDLKTGRTPASIRQLEVYTALFCLEYDIKPNDIEIELRIYQNDEMMIENPKSDDIFHIMDKIISFDKAIEKIKMEV